MNKALLSLILLTSLVLSSCSKSDEPRLEEHCRVTELSTERWRWTFEYDGEGRVSKETEHFSDFVAVIYRFNYLDEAIEVERYENDRLVMDYLYTVDDKGRISDGYDKINEGVNVRYIYDENDYMVRELSDNESFMLYLEYDNGNLVHWKCGSIADPTKERSENSIDYDTRESNYPYSSRVVNLYGPTFRDAMHKSVLLEAGYFGKKVKNLPIHATLQHFSVEKDSKGKVIQVNETFDGSEFTNGPYRFRYRCD